MQENFSVAWKSRYESALLVHVSAWQCKHEYSSEKILCRNVVAS